MRQPCGLAGVLLFFFCNFNRNQIGTKKLFLHLVGLDPVDPVNHVRLSIAA